MGLAPLTLTTKNSQNFCFLSLQLWALLVWSLGFQESNTNGSTEKIWDSSLAILRPLCHGKWKWKSLSHVQHLRLHGLYSPWNSSGQDTGVGSLFLLQRIFPTQELNWGLLHCRRILYQLSCQGSIWDSCGPQSWQSLHWSLILETVFLKELFTRSALLILILVLNSFFQMSILFPLPIPQHLISLLGQQHLS